MHFFCARTYVRHVRNTIKVPPPAARATLASQAALSPQKLENIAENGQQSNRRKVLKTQSI